MTKGSILRHVLMFALPLMVGNLFQQLYNMVDTWVVGNFVSNEAFSAVGTVSPVVNLMIGFFSGLSSGAGVVISQNYGAGKPERNLRSGMRNPPCKTCKRMQTVQTVHPIRSNPIRP